MTRILLLAASAAALAAEPVSFERQIRPLLAQRCEVCHKGPAAQAAVDLSTFDGVRASRDRVLAAIGVNPPRMPKTGRPLTQDEVAQVRLWIEQGARNDGGKDERWWSLRPLTRPATPSAEANPIDAFVAAKWKSAGLTGSPAADRRTLLRRVSFDLTGFPPSLEEVRRFEADPSPDAYEAAVDRLLASSRHGERWARHWLDVAHYGDSHGYDKDKPRPNAWPYRDWAIAALNRDKPYTRFVEEQLAGDVLYPEDPEAFVATGFLAAGPWDFVGHQELKEGTLDKNLTRNLDRDDVVAQVMSAFTSTTAHCARCHNHKFDPIPQADYYGLQAVFAGIDRADRPYDTDPALHVRRQALLAKRREAQAALQPLLDRVEFATSPEIVELDIRIQDAGLLLAHLGQPKTPAEEAEKKMLTERRESDRARRQQLVDAIAGAETLTEAERRKTQVKALDEELAALPKPSYVYAPASYFVRAGNFRPSLVPRPVHVLARGDVKSPLTPAAPGALSMVAGVPFAAVTAPLEGERRAALAKWITSKDNVLTWRSIVNRVWHYHFGAGLVDTPNDFGRMGSQPSHPELLDWLAVWFRDDARGSLKQLHRLIVTSKVYRQSSNDRPEASRIDASNRLLWRMNRMRLEAETVRDAVLEAAGQLDRTAGGPAVRMFFFKDDHSPVYDYARFDPATPGANRRSIYRFAVRSVPDPFMDRLDCPDPSVLTPKRNTTLTAIQALALLNNPFMVRMAAALANQVRGDDAVRKAVARVWQRDPTPEERRQFEAYADKHGLENLCRLLFNTNEFLFAD